MTLWCGSGSPDLYQWLLNRDLVPDPYLWPFISDLDPTGQKTSGSGGSWCAFGSGSPTLAFYIVRAYIIRVENSVGDPEPYSGLHDPYFCWVPDPDPGALVRDRDFARARYLVSDPSLFSKNGWQNRIVTQNISKICTTQDEVQYQWIRCMKKLWNIIIFAVLGIQNKSSVSRFWSGSGLKLVSDLDPVLDPDLDQRLS